MKSYVILRNWHYCLNFFPTIYFRSFWKHVEKQHYLFDWRTKYISEEESAVNKLFGLCYGLFGIHKESDRFGWTFDAGTNSFKIFAYSYNRGKLFKKELASFKHEVALTLAIETEYYKYHRNVNFYINDALCLSRSYSYPFLSRWVYKVGPYFGGKVSAPNTIKIVKL